MKKKNCNIYTCPNLKRNVGAVIGETRTTSFKKACSNANKGGHVEKVHLLEGWPPS